MKFYPLLIFIFLSCKSDLTDNETRASYPVFYIEEIEVVINGYDSDAMEPFITKDGKCLFFNSLNDAVNTSLYYATKLNDTVFDFQGEISGVNGDAPHLDAIASMDSYNQFYFVSTRNYPTVFENYQTGYFNSGIVTDVTPVLGNIYNYSPGWLIMDGEISKDGNTLYYVNAKFSGQSFPDETILAIASKQDTLFERIDLSEQILTNVNNPDYLIYAPSISSDEKELYFTRSKKGTTGTEICVSSRPDKTIIFSEPITIMISGSMIEAPTLTDDRSRLYYHKKLSSDGKYHIFTMKRK